MKKYNVKCDYLIQSSSEPLAQYIDTGYEIEKVTGIDYFSGLDDQLENQLEGTINAGGCSF